MGFRGGKFTWKRGRMERTFLAKRLDRLLCCAQTRLTWQEATVTHLSFLSSDHAPLYVQLSPVSASDPKRRPFRFKAAWLQHPNFKELVSTSWKGNHGTNAALVELRKVLIRLNKEVFGDVVRRKEYLLWEINEVQDALERGPSDTLLAREDVLIKELDVVLEQEEMLWFQKSREKWIPLGDRNTRFFHTSTVIRRHKNIIDMLKKEDGNWTADAQEMESLAISYFKLLYSMEDVEAVVDKLPANGFAQLFREEKNHLHRGFSALEVESAVRSMGRYKAPGPDGFQPVFYQSCWDTVGSSVTRFVLDFFATWDLPPGTNDVLLVLIAKVSKPESITQFRPISLCNVIFKTITKTLVERLKAVVSKLIGPAQASIIPGRLSTDNIVLVQEAVHSVRRKKGRGGWMLLKLDLEKAYDRIRWDILEDTLNAVGFNDTWIQWIMRCVSGPVMNLLWNGEKTEAFTPLRGLRQGDPISPYLFVLCMERLCHMIESASRQKVSLEKSTIFFSGNVSWELEQSISKASGIRSSHDLEKYLGMHVLHKRLNKNTFGEVLERVSAKLAGWKSCTLSMAGRLTLTKSVLSSVPVHSMSFILLPKSTLASLDKISRSFLWGSTAEKKKQHLVSWKKVYLPKAEGGLGIQTSKDMNLAMIAKVGWRLLQEEESLWARVMWKKYRVGDIHDPSWLLPKSSWSVLWKGVVRGLKEVVWPGHYWVAGDGENIKFWTDNWISEEPLVNSATGNLPVEARSWLVKDVWRDGVGWDIPKLSLYLPYHVVLELMAVVLDHVTGARDRLAWKGSSNG
ncbi:unnamed protein product [Microthlaspi erraticum]|uniref:Reverse transcriptase domain-containing protein n=1 Tax=Microthlaspi erraticum TaxID=1685480 RepID=A0A6D2HVF0_9BRAS|nr:unnamed protein product [Microthlaspi erraticum]